MEMLLNTEHRATLPRYGDATMVLGCVFLSILLTGGTVLATKSVMYAIGLQ